MILCYAEMKAVGGVLKYAKGKMMNLEKRERKNSILNQRYFSTTDRERYCPFVQVFTLFVR